MSNRDKKQTIAINVDDPLSQLSYLQLNVGTFVTPWHKHKKRHQVLFTQSGALNIRTRNVHVLLPARHGCFIPLGLEHQLQSDSTVMSLRTVYFSTTSKDPILFQNLHTFPVPKLGQTLIAEIPNWPEENPIAHQSMALLRSFTAEWILNDVKLQLPTTNNTKLMGMLTAMLERLDQRLNARDIADEFGYSERSLIRTFQHELGMSYGQFKKIARIIKAVELLSLDSPRISDVMFAVGYESPSTFTQNFKELLGMTPSAYLATQR